MPTFMRYKVAIIAVVVLGIVGVGIALINVHAATGIVSSEPEVATVTAPAAVVNDTTASGGKAIKYAPASSSGITFNHCTNPTYTKPTNPNNPQDGITLGGYYLATDTWNFAKYPSSTQTMYICNYDNWYVTMNLTDTANNGEVKNYPNVHKDFSDPAVSSFTKISSIFAHTAPTYGDWDVAYDVWFNGLATELMIWTQSNGRQAHVPGIPQVGSVTIDGITYNIHKTNGGYVAYDMPTTHTSGTVNILGIIKDAQSRGYIPNNATLTQIGYGVEGCNTNGIDTKFEFNNFSLTTQ